MIELPDTAWFHLPPEIQIEALRGRLVHAEEKCRSQDRHIASLEQRLSELTGMIPSRDYGATTLDDMLVRIDKRLHDLEGWSAAQRQEQHSMAAPRPIRRDRMNRFRVGDEGDDAEPE